MHPINNNVIGFSFNQWHIVRILVLISFEVTITKIKCCRESYIHTCNWLCTCELSLLFFCILFLVDFTSIKQTDFCCLNPFLTHRQIYLSVIKSFCYSVIHEEQEICSRVVFVLVHSLLEHVIQTSNGIFFSVFFPPIGNFSIALEF